MEMGISMNHKTEGDRPFIIYTLQRTGGTNLTKQLNLRSSFPLAKQHEPFNRPRVYGHITERWIKERNVDHLYRDVNEVVEKHENIKHCVEMIPDDITNALIDASANGGYRHLFLFRRDPAARILSMEYARRTRVWGPSHIAKARDDKTAFESPLEVTQLLEREAHCIEQLNNAWHRLRSAGQNPKALAYEDLYGKDYNVAERTLFRVLGYLSLSKRPVDDRILLQELRGSGDQNTRDRYGQFIGVDALRDRTQNLPKYAFDAAA